MVKLQYNQRQYTITLSADLVKRMGWAQGTELFVSKDPHSNMLYMEEIKTAEQPSSSVRTNHREDKAK